MVAWPGLSACTDHMHAEVGAEIGTEYDARAPEAVAMMYVSAPSFSSSLLGFPTLPAPAILDHPSYCYGGIADKFVNLLVLASHHYAAGTTVETFYPG